MIKRIHNPKTKSYYATREKTTKAGRKGQIVGKYKMKSTAKKIGRDYGYILKEMSKK